MYLSSLILNIRNYQVRKDLADCQGLHRTILKAFSQSAPSPVEKNSHARQDFGLLYRVENSRHENEVRILVQSQCQPDWSLLPPGYCEAKGPKFIADKFQSLANGQVLSFLLKANPTHKTGTASKMERLAGKKNNGKRIFIRRTEEQLHWLAQKGEKGGFKLLSVQINPEVCDVDTRPDLRIKGWKKLNQKDGPEPVKWEMTFGAVVFQGHLQITNKEDFLKTLANGLGSGKAYGFGLLSIAPPR
ncbi:MAG: type I-E CRISPR-associated protein Cas6/Cse3/CasE [Bacillota bacterium]